MKYAVVTFGCRVNQADSLGFEEELLAAGAVSAAPHDADLVIVNTCSVTATSDQGARQTIRRLARENPSARIVVSGCYATRRPEEVGALPNVAQVIANDDKPRLLQLVGRQACADGTSSLLPIAVALTTRERSTAERFGDGEGACGAAIEPGVAGRTAFTLRVQTGCDEPCSYCIIPETRGTARSVPIADAVREAQRVADAGFKEIALTGVHLGSYGRDLAPRSSLIDLLHALDGLTNRGVRLPRDFARDRQPDLLFRISSLEPMDCTSEIVDLVAASPSFAPHFHLPLQHASDRVLARMRRPYTRAQYASLVDGIRARVPSASIGSDIIVGFPGETSEDFAALVTYLERSPLTHLHVFPYSDRPGTAASALGGKVPGADVRERARVVRDVGRRLSTAFRDAQFGTVHRALTIDDGSTVVTGNYQKLKIAAGRARNEWVTVRVVSHEDGVVVESGFAS